MALFPVHSFVRLSDGSLYSSATEILINTDFIVGIETKDEAYATTGITNVVYNNKVNETGVSVTLIVTEDIEDFVTVMDITAQLALKVDKTDFTDGLPEDVGSDGQVLTSTGTGEEWAALPQGVAVADAVDDTDVVAQFNALLASLRTAGYLAV